MLRMIAAIRPVRPEFAFLTGCREPAFVPMLFVGCSGATLALSGVVPEVTTHLMRLAGSGNFKAALEIQVHLTELFDQLLFKADFPEGIR